MSKKSRRRESVGRSRVLEARAARERQRQRKYWLAAAAVGAVLLLILAAGWFDLNVIQPAAPIAVVDGQSVRTDTFQKLARYVRASAYGRLQQLQQQKQQFGDDPTFAQFKQLIDQQIQQAQTQYQGAPQQSFDYLVEAELVKTEAQKRAVSVSDQEVQTEIEQQIASGKSFVTVPQATATAAAAITATATAQAQPSPSPTATLTPTTGVTSTEAITTTPTPNPSPTPSHIMTSDEFKLEYQNLLTTVARTAGWNEDEYREFVRTQLLRRKLSDVFASTVPTTTEQIHARHILVETKEQADAALQRVKNGEDFAAVAKDVSKDTGSKDSGGDLGWFGRGQMVKPFEDTAFALKPNQISDPVTSQFGFHIIQLLEGPEVRALDAAALRQKQSAALTTWLSDLKDKLRNDGKFISYYSTSKDPR